MPAHSPRKPAPTSTARRRPNKTDLAATVQDQTKYIVDLTAEVAHLKSNLATELTDAQADRLAAGRFRVALSETLDTVGHWAQTGFDPIEHIAEEARVLILRLRSFFDEPMALRYHDVIAAARKTANDYRVFSIAHQAFENSENQDSTDEPRLRLPVELLRAVEAFDRMPASKGFRFEYPFPALGQVPLPRPRSKGQGA